MRPPVTISINNGSVSGKLELLFEGEILRVPGFDLRKIRAGDKWERADDNLVSFENLWNDKQYWYDSSDPDYRKLGRDNKKFQEIQTEKTGLYRLTGLDSYDTAMIRDDLNVILDRGNLYCWVRFYGRIEIHGVIYGGTKTKVIITHIQKIYFRKVV
ncbi:MAG TPA: hypothetical protein PK514_12515 [Spirochaetota bacterium]|nr:hypothetical protein [Spirochaetota bacterium]